MNNILKPKHNIEIIHLIKNMSSFEYLEKFCGKDNKENYNKIPKNIKIGFKKKYANFAINKNHILTYSYWAIWICWMIIGYFKGIKSSPDLSSILGSIWFYISFIIYSLLVLMILNLIISIKYIKWRQKRVEISLQAFRDILDTHMENLF